MREGEATRRKQRQDKGNKATRQMQRQGGKYRGKEAGQHEKNIFARFDGVLIFFMFLCPGGTSAG